MPAIAISRSRMKAAGERCSVSWISCFGYARGASNEEAMHYRLELEINAPRERVVELFLDPDNLQKWQPDLVSFEQIGSGAPREVGAKSKQVHRMGKREFEMIETI